MRFKANYLRKTITYTKNTVLYVSAVLLILPSVVMLYHPTKVEAATTLNFTELATHPQAAAQATDQGKTLNNLKIFDGKLYAAYGDYGANTGPIDINPFDLNSGTFDGVALSVPTESLGTWKEINGKLYTPTIDPQCSGTCPAGYAVYTPGEGWAMETPVNAEHIFDVETLTGTDIWLFGSAGGGTATAWRSTDGGSTFNVAQTYANEPEGDNTERYYWGAAMDGKMYMQSDHGGYQNPVQIFDGANWTTGTTESLCRVGNNGATPRSVVFEGKIVCSYSSSVKTFDGAMSSVRDGYSYPPYPQCNSEAGQISVENGYYYALCRFWNGSGFDPATLIKSNDLASFRTFDNLPSAASSFAIDDQKLYVATTDSKIYVADLPDPDTTDPEVSITSPSNNQTVSQPAIMLQASANDDESGIDKVEFYDGDTLISSDYEAPYTSVWRNYYDGDNLYPEGDYTFTARAYNGEGGVSESAPITIHFIPPTHEIDMVEYDTGMLPVAITADDQDNIWFMAANFENGGAEGLYRFDSNTYTITPYDIPDGQTFETSAVGQMVYARGRLWVADCAENAVKAYVVQTGQVETYNFDAVCSGQVLQVLAASSSGIVYNYDHDNDKINIVDAQNDTTQINLPENVNNLYSIATAKDGKLLMNFNGNDIFGVATFDSNNQFQVLYSQEDTNDDSSIPLYSIGMTSLNNEDVVLGSVSGQDVGLPLLNRITNGQVIATAKAYETIAWRVLSGTDNRVWFLQGDGMLGRLDDGAESPQLYGRILTQMPDGFMGMDAETLDMFNSFSLGYYSGSMTIDSMNNVWVADTLAGRLIKVSAQNSSPEEPDGNVDSDSDGIPNTTEQAGPNNGDANGDGIADSTQANITSLKYNDSNYVVLETACNTNFNVQNGLESSNMPDPAYTYPAGLLSFVGLDCGDAGADVDVKLYYYGNFASGGHILRKWHNTNYSTIAGAILTNTNIGGQPVLQATYVVQDGGELDQDNQADGNIVDPVGLASSTVGSPNTGQNTHWLLDIN